MGKLITPGAPASTWSANPHPLRYVETGSVTWELLEAGSGEPVVLVLGGGFSTALTAAPRVSRWAGRARVIATSYPIVPNLGELMDALVSLLDVLEIERVRIFGHSLGAALGHVLVRRYPTRVERLALSGFGLYTPKRARRFKHLTAVWRRLPFELLRSTYRRRFGRLVSQAPEAERPALAAHVSHLLASMTPEMAFSQLNLLMDMMDRARDYAVFEPVRDQPVVFVAARDDRGFRPEEREALLTTYPGAAVYLFPDGGHWVARHRKEEVDPILDEFLLFKDKVMA